MIVLLRERTQPDPYVDLLKANGHNVINIPVLSTEFICAEIPVPSSFSGLIITSKRALNPLSKWDIEGWKRKTVFAIGKTCTVISEMGFLDVQGSDCKNSSEMGDMIMAGSKNDLPLLYLTGDKTLKVIQDRMSESGVSFVEVQVYKTSSIQIDHSILVGNEVVVFSPSGLDSISCSLASLDVRWIAIGGTTGAALRRRGVECVECLHPSPGGVLEAIK